jgi:hypothetical protein
MKDSTAKSSYERAVELVSKVFSDERHPYNPASQEKDLEETMSMQVDHHTRSSSDFGGSEIRWSDFGGSEDGYLWSGISDISSLDESICWSDSGEDDEEMEQAERTQSTHTQAAGKTSFEWKVTAWLESVSGQQDWRTDEGCQPDYASTQRETISCSGRQSFSACKSPL